MDQTTISCIAVACTVCGIMLAYIGYLKGTKKDYYSAGANNGKLETDIQYIKHRTDDVLLEQKDTNKSINVLAERVTRVEESAKSAHKRIDCLGGESHEQTK